MNTCDHSKCATPFCPICGKAMKDTEHSPVALLAYLRKFEKTQLTRVGKAHPRHKEMDGTKGMERSAERFRAWGDWVQAQIEKGTK